MDRDQTRNLRDMILPLRVIFWGGIICIVDITFSQTVTAS